METYIALFRGINVCGRNILPMADLKDLLHSIGLQNVKTYIQSGNVVFQAKDINFSDVSFQIKNALEASHGFSPEILILRLEQFSTALSTNPFPEAEPKTLHLFFLATVPQAPDLEKIDQLKQNGEKFALVDKVFYLYAPEGIGRSKLASKVEKLLGVPTTARNWRTVNKIIDLA